VVKSSALPQEASDSNVEMIPKSDFIEFRVNKNEEDIKKNEDTISRIIDTVNTIQITQVEILGIAKSSAKWEKIIGTGLCAVVVGILGLFFVLIKAL
jgi:hypothetical protein